MLQRQVQVRSERQILSVVLGIDAPIFDISHRYFIAAALSHSHIQTLQSALNFSIDAHLPHFKLSHGREPYDNFCDLVVRDLRAIIVLVAP